jgi:hypothetical protein
MTDQTSGNGSPGRQRITVRVMTFDATVTVMQPLPMTVADLADNIRLGDDADQQLIRIADDDEIAIEVAQKRRRVDVRGIVANYDQPVARSEQYSFHEHQVNLHDK